LYLKKRRLAEFPVFQTRQAPVSDFAVQPGVRVLWRLRRRATDVRCLLRGQLPVEVQVLHDRDLVVTQIFQEEWMALDWARAYGERLRAQGWRDVRDTVEGTAGPADPAHPA
jgi:hypothetical protein